MSTTTDQTRHESERRHHHERQHQSFRPRDDHTPVDSPAKAKSSKRTGTPEALRAAKVAQRGRTDQTKAADSARRARGVEWVRPTDLVARKSATFAGLGIDFDVELARRTRRLTGQVTRATGRGIGRAGRAVTERARRLPDVSEFGRGSRHYSWVSRSGIGLG